MLNVLARTIFLALLLRSTSLFSAESSPVTPAPSFLTDVSTTTNVSGDLRAELEFSRNGLTSIPVNGGDTSLSTLRVPVAHINWQGKLSPETDFRVRINPTGGLGNNADGSNSPSDLLDYCYATWWYSEMFGIRMGKDRVNIGGFQNVQAGEANELWGETPYDAVTPFRRFSPTLAFHLQIAWTLILQVTNDVTTTSSVVDRFAAAQTNSQADARIGHSVTNAPGHWNESSKQPAVVIQYTGKLGPITPLIQVAQYDLNHSRYVGGGAKIEIADLSLSLDYYMDMRALRVNDENGNPSDRKLIFTDGALRAQYALKGIGTPFLWIDRFERRGEKGILNEADDLTSNANPDTILQSDGTIARNAACLSRGQCFDDHALEIAVGSYFSFAGGGLTPFVVARQVAGRFYSLQGSLSEAKMAAINTLTAGAIARF